DTSLMRDLLVEALSNSISPPVAISPHLDPWFFARAARILSLIMHHEQVNVPAPDRDIGTCDRYRLATNRKPSSSERTTRRRSSKTSSVRKPSPSSVTASRAAASRST